MSKQVFKVMDRTGDTRFQFEGTTDAETKFKELVAQGFLPVASDPTTGEQRAYRTYDPSVETTVFRAPLCGG